MVHPGSVDDALQRSVDTGTSHTRTGLLADVPDQMVDLVRSGHVDLVVFHPGTQCPQFLNRMPMRRQWGTAREDQGRVLCPCGDFSGNNQPEPAEPAGDEVGTAILPGAGGLLPSSVQHAPA